MSDPQTADERGAHSPLIQPLPWRYEQSGPLVAKVFDANGVLVFPGVTRDEAALICNSVNHHEALVAALKAHDAYMRDSGYEGPDSTALHPKAAENWKRIMAALTAVESR